MSKCDICKHKADDERWMFCDRCIHSSGLEDMYKPVTNADHWCLVAKLQPPYESPTGQKG